MAITSKEASQGIEEEFGPVLSTPAHSSWRCMQP